MRYEPGRRWLRAGNRAPARGGLGVYSPDLFLVQHKDFAPIPPTPFPSGEGGDFRLFLCKGLRPLHPRG